MQAGAGLEATRRRPGTARTLALLGVAALIGAGAGVGLHFLFADKAHSPVLGAGDTKLFGQATWPAGARPAPPITRLRDQGNQRFSLESLRGHTVAIEFFDSHCRQECPLAGRTMAAAERSLPPAQRPVLVVVSVNPLDTAGSTRAAIRAWGLAGVAPWHWLRGTHRQLASVWKAYREYVKPERGDIVHTEALYLIDRRGDERSGYLYPYIPRSVSHDLRTLATAPSPARHD